MDSGMVQGLVISLMSLIGLYGVVDAHRRGEVNATYFAWMNLKHRREDNPIRFRIFLAVGAATLLCTLGGGVLLMLGLMDPLL